MSLDIPTCVIAPTNLAFEAWCRENEISPRSKGVIWIRGAGGLRGLDKVRVVVANDRVVLSEQLKDELHMMEKQGRIAPAPTLPTVTA